MGLEQSWSPDTHPWREGGRHVKLKKENDVWEARQVCVTTSRPPEEGTQALVLQKGGVLSNWFLSVPSSDLAVLRGDNEADDDKNSNSPLVKHIGVRRGRKCFYLYDLKSRRAEQGSLLF